MNKIEITILDAMKNQVGASELFWPIVERENHNYSYFRLESQRQSRELQIASEWQRCIL